MKRPKCDSAGKHQLGKCKGRILEYVTTGRCYQKHFYFCDAHAREYGNWTKLGLKKVVRISL